MLCFPLSLSLSLSQSLDLSHSEETGEEERGEMWRLKVGASDTVSQTWLSSLNDHVGRQTWEFDPSPPTNPSDLVEVENARQEFAQNRLVRKHSADKLMRLQVILNLSLSRCLFVHAGVSKFYASMYLCIFVYIYEICICICMWRAWDDMQSQNVCFLMYLKVFVSWIHVCMHLSIYVTIPIKTCLDPQFNVTLRCQ